MNSAFSNHTTHSHTDYEIMIEQLDESIDTMMAIWGDWRKSVYAFYTRFTWGCKTLFEFLNRSNPRYQGISVPVYGFYALVAEASLARAGTRTCNTYPSNTEV